MKDKTTTAILALFLGYFGVHRFYLRQNGLGVLYFFLAFVGIGFFLGIIDFFRFLFMEEDLFNFKYNRDQYPDATGNTDFDRRRHRRVVRSGPRGTRIIPVQKQQKRSRPFPPKKRARASQSNHYHQRGIEKYRNFDYPGAIDDFVKALEVEPESIPLHFNIACAYSLIEQADQAFFHLNKAVEFGFKDFEKIRSHDALAYIRIKEEFETFAENGYRLLQARENQPLVCSRPIPTCWSNCANWASCGNANC